MRVLVVEDETDMADAVARGLRREGYAVDVAYDGTAALEKLGYVEYDVVCLDLTLPGVDGRDVCRAVRARRRRRDTTHRHGDRQRLPARRRPHPTHGARMTTRAADAAHVSRTRSLADHLPTWFGSIRFRIAAIYSLVLFGLATLAVG